MADNKIVIDSKDVAEATSRLKQLSAELDKTSTANTKNESTVKSLALEYKRAAEEISKLKDASSGASSAASGLIAGLSPMAIGIGLVATAAIGAASYMKDLVLGVVNTRAELGHLSIQTGISATALAGLKNIAGLSGTSLESVAELTKKFNKAVADTANDTSVQAQAFHNLGISVKDANGNYKDTLVLQQEAAAKLNNHTEGIQRDAYYMAIWGKAAIENKEYLRDLGKQQDITSKLTQEQVDKALELERSFKVLSKSGGEIKNALADLVVPWLAETTKGMVDLIRAANGMKNAFANMDLYKATGPELNAKLKATTDELENLKSRKENGQSLFDPSYETQLDKRIPKLEERRRILENLLRLETRYAEEERARFASTDPRMKEAGTRLATDEENRMGLKSLKEKPEKTDPVPTLEREITAQRLKLMALEGVSEELIVILKYTDEYYSKYPKQQVEELRNIELKEIALKKEKAAKEEAEKKQKDLNKAYEEDIKRFWEKAAKQKEAYDKSLQQIKDETALKAIEVTVMQKYGATQDDVNIAQNEYNLMKAESVLISAQQLGADYLEISALEDQVRLLKEKSKQLGIVKDINDTEKQRQSTFKNGWEQSFKKYQDDANNAAKNASQIFSTASKGMEDAIVNFAKTGKLSFKDFANSVIEDLLRIAARKAAAGIFQLIGGAFGFSANGNAFDQGGMLKSANGNVFDSPTLHTYSGGIGMLGEAGPEAVMPLKRNSSGQLGVVAQGGSQSSPIYITVNVQGGKTNDETGNAVANKVAEQFTRGIVRQELMAAKRTGGILNPV